MTNSTDSEPQIPLTDPVNHPAHYCVNGIEALDVIEAFELPYHLGNVIKYLLRAGRKTDYWCDLKKAQFYLNRYIARGMQNATSESTGD